MPNKPNCSTCEYKRLQTLANSKVSEPDNAHCYMFEKEPQGCMCWKAIEFKARVNVGTIGHIDMNSAPHLEGIFQEIFGGR